MTRRRKFKRPWVADANGNYTFKRAVAGDELVTLALEVLRRRHRKGATIMSPEAARRWFRLELADDLEEIFGILWLDNRHRVIEFERMFRGSIAQSSVFPRAIVRSAMAKNAAACMLVHNHPSGVCEPSIADREITDRIVDALKLIDVRVLDHHVVTPTEAMSFSERGYL